MVREPLAGGPRPVRGARGTPVCVECATEGGKTLATHVSMVTGRLINTVVEKVSSGAPAGSIPGLPPASLCGREGSLSLSVPCGRRVVSQGPGRGD